MRFNAISLSGAVLLMLSSCAATEDQVSGPDEVSPMTVTFDVAPGGELVSRAGENEEPVPTRALMYVIDRTTSEVLAKAQPGTAADGNFQFSIELDRNHIYDIAFWADCGAEAYVIDKEEGLGRITYTYPQPENVSLIAYSMYETGFLPTTATKEILLEHAVAKLIIREGSGINKDDEVGVSFTRKNYIFSATDGSYAVPSGSDVRVEEKVVLTHRAAADTDKGDLITTYMLAPNDRSRQTSSGPAMMVNDFKLSYKPGGGEASERGISNVAFKSNFRTVINGNMVNLSKLTQSFTVSIDNEWKDMDSPGIGDGGDTPGVDDPVTPVVPEIVLKVAGTLTESMLTDAVSSGDALKVSGPMDDRDFGVLRAYLSADGAGGEKQLKLDLSGAAFTAMPVFAFSNGDFYGKANPNPVSGLREIDLPEGLAVIPEGAFSDCMNLERVGLPSTLTTIWPIGFYRTALKRLDGPSVTIIYENAFESCHQLASVTVGNLAEIRMAAFRDCGNLRTFDMTRCTRVPAASHNIFGNNGDKTPDLTIYVGSADILNSLSNDTKWNITEPKWVVGAPAD